MNSTTFSLPSYLANIQIQIIRSLLTPIYIIGTLNNLANIMIFYQSSLRSHICSWYFIGASIGHLVYLNFGCLTRILWAWTQYDLSLISLSFCKTRIYFVLDGLIISRYLFCLISIDRWMITSRNNKIRQLSSSKVARWLILGGVSFLLILNVFISIDYVIDKITGCGPGTKPAYALFYTVYNTALSLVPLCTLSIFSLLTLFNIRRASHQISPVTRVMSTMTQDTSQARRPYKKKDIQFIKLALVQVAGYMLFNTLHGYNTIYGVITTNNKKSPDQRAIDGFIYGIGLNLHYTYTGVFVSIVLKHVHCALYLDNFLSVYNGINHFSQGLR